MAALLPDSSLDAILAVQLTVAWAGETYFAGQVISEVLSCQEAKQESTRGDGNVPGRNR